MSDPTPRRNPYVGPRSFDLRESLFFGRDRETRELTALLTARRVVLLHSPAGAGKTSLIQAALIPTLEKRKFFTHPPIRVSKPAPPGTANRYVHSAILSLAGGVGDPAVAVGTTLAGYLNGRPAPVDARGNPLSEVLIFDQFEEVLTLDEHDRPAKREFFRQLAEVLEVEGDAGTRPRWALFALREEYLGIVVAGMRGMPTGSGAHYRLGLLDGEGALAAIRGPGASQGVTFAPGAAVRLVRQLTGHKAADDDLPETDDAAVGGLAVEPVQLQVVCFRMWDKLGTRTVVSPDDVDKLADVENALAGYYRDRVEQAAAKSGAGEAEIRNWCGSALITPGGVRAIVQEGPGLDPGLPPDAITQLVNAFLVRRDRKGDLAWLELSHDRLVEPVRRDNREWLAPRRRPFQIQADEWAARSPGLERDWLLARGVSLLEAEQWATAHPAEVRDVDTEFIEQSRAVRTAGERVRTTFYQWLARITTTVALVGVVLLVLAVRGWNAADAAADEARKHEKKAKLETQRADDEAKNARENAKQVRVSLDAQTQVYVRVLRQLATSASRLATATDIDEVRHATDACFTLYGIITSSVVSPDMPNPPPDLERLAAYHKELRAKGAAERHNPPRMTLNLARTLGVAIKQSEPHGPEILSRLRRQFYAEAIAITSAIRDTPDLEDRAAEHSHKKDEKETDRLGMKLSPNIRRFWQLYYGTMAIVEGERVTGAMVAVGRAIQDRDWNALPGRVDALQKACEAELAADRPPNP